jgi:DnaJ-domain-containing protein 1
MSWEKKAEELFGGAFRGPMTDAVAAGVGKAIEATKRAAGELASDVRLEVLSVRHGVAMPQGDAVAIACALTTRAPLPPGLAIWAYFGDEATAWKGSHPSFVDADGDLFTAAPAVIEPGARRARALVGVPYVAFPLADTAEVVVRLIAASGDGAPIASHVERVAWPTPSAREALSVLRALACSAAGMLACAGHDDARGRDATERALAGAFHPDALGRAAIARALDEAFARAVDAAEAADALLRSSPPEERAHALELLFDVASRDGALLAPSEAYLRALAARLGAPANVIDAAKARRPALDLTPHFRALDLEPGASWAEVKKAYVKLARDYHPDKVQTLPQGFHDYATERMREANAAKDALARALDRGVTPTRA